MKKVIPVTLFSIGILCTQHTLAQNPQLDVNHILNDFLKKSTLCIHQGSTLKNRVTLCKMLNEFLTAGKEAKYPWNNQEKTNLRLISEKLTTIKQTAENELTYTHNKKQYSLEDIPQTQLLLNSGMPLVSLGLFLIGNIASTLFKIDLTSKQQVGLFGITSLPCTLPWLAIRYKKKNIEHIHSIQSQIEKITSKI